MGQQTNKTRRPSSKRPPRRGALRPHAVILHRDEFNGIGYTASVLRQVFRMGRFPSMWMATKARLFKRCVIWRGSLEVAEFKAEQVLRCGTDMLYLDQDALPLYVTVEALS
jgi:ATP-dependent Clp protease adapter protein ClpS